MTTEDNQKILDVESARYAAMLAGDCAALEPLLDEDLLYTHSDGARDSRETYLEKVRQGHFIYHAIDHPAEKVVVLSDCAIVVGRMHASVSVAGSRRQINNASIAVYRKVENGWCLLMYQPTPLHA